MRPFNCVGIGERRAVRDTDVMSGNVKLALSHVVPDLVLKVLKGQDPLHILGDGNQVRHYTYGGDLARGIRLAMESPAAVNDDFNLSTAQSTTVLELAELHLVQDPRRHGRSVTSPIRRSSTTSSGASPTFSKAQRPGLRGDDLARNDARRGHPVDPGRARGGTAVTRTPGGAILGDIYDARFGDRERRTKSQMWAQVVRYLGPLIDADRPVLDVACDAGYFIRHVRATERWATDIRDVSADLPSGVRFVQADGLTLRDTLPNGHFGTVFMSNYLEHLASSDEVVRADPRRA